MLFGLLWLGGGAGGQGVSWMDGVLLAHHRRLLRWIPSRCGSQLSSELLQKFLFHTEYQIHPYVRKLYCAAVETPHRGGGGLFLLSFLRMKRLSCWADVVGPPSCAVWGMWSLWPPLPPPCWVLCGPQFPEDNHEVLCFPGIEDWGAYYCTSTWTSSLFGASILDQAHDGCDILQYDDGVGAMGDDWAYSMNSTELRMQPWGT